MPCATCRANSSTLPLPPLDAADLSHMTSNVGQLYAWLLARQQQHQMAITSEAAALHAAHTALLPPHLMPMGLAGGYGYPLMQAPSCAQPAPYPLMGGMLPGALPVAPPLFNVAKGI
jgi:hypothetical protein